MKKLEDIKMGNIFSKFTINYLLENKKNVNDISKCIKEPEDFIKKIIKKNNVLNAEQVWDLKKEFDIDFNLIMFDMSDSPEPFSRYFINFVKNHKDLKNEIRRFSSTTNKL